MQNEGPSKRLSRRSLLSLIGMTAGSAVMHQAMSSLGLAAESGYKGPITHAAGSVAAEYIMVQMCASVASGQATPEEAAKEADRRTRRYYRG